MLFLKSPCSLAYFCHSSLIIFPLIIVWAYGAMETHQTSDLRIAGSIPAMLVFLDDKKHIKDKSIYQKGQKEKEKNTSLSYISYILSKKKAKR